MHSRRDNGWFLNALIVAAAIGLLVALVWANLSPSAGIVAEKRHEPARTSSRYITTHHGDGSSSGSWVPHYEPEKWSVRIQAAAKPDGKKGRSGWVTVTRELWERLPIGAHWHPNMTYEDAEDRR